MKSKNKLLIFITTIIVMIIALICTVSKAYSIGSYGEGLDKIKTMGISAVGNTIKARLKDLKERKDLYCVQQGASVSGDVDYKIGEYVTIDGNKATCNDKTSNSIENGKLAYILNRAEGYGGKIPDQTLTQLAVWLQINTWSDEVSDKYFGFNVKYTSDKDGVGNEEIDLLTPKIKSKKCYSQDQVNDAKNIIKEAEDYANRIGNSAQNQGVQDRTDKNNVRHTSYTENNTAYIRVGPFKWDFNGTIDNVNVYGDNDKEISNIKFSKFEGNTERILNGCSEINTGDDFYIILEANTGVAQIKTIKATTKNIINVYTAEIWFLEAEEDQNLMLVTPGIKEEEDLIETPLGYNIPLTKDLTIVKVDSRNNNIKLAGVGFKIQNKETQKYVRKQNGQITYVDNVNNATEFITDANGQIKIDGLIIGTYLAFETKNPNYGYKKIDGDIEIAASTYKKVIPNEQVYVKLSGYVWKDIQSTKQTIRNDLYRKDSSDDKDEAFNGIVVKLKNKNTGSTENYVTTKEQGLYKEIDGGEYKFKNVRIDQLSNYYIEFEYDGLIWQSVVLNTNVDRGSKATDKVEREILDKNFASVNSTGRNFVNVKDESSNDKYSIEYNDTVQGKTSIKDSSACKLNANTKDSGYDLSKQYSAGTTEIKYINLGLYEKPQADLSLSQDLDNVNIGVNGYWHIYNYSKRKLTDGGYDANNSSTWNVGVKFKNSYTGTYNRAIYQSDLEYENPNDRNKELQVYLTYKIALTNESSYLTKVNSIIDYFDNRYTLTAVGTGLDKQKNITGNISYQNTEKYNDKYQKCVINVDTTVKSGESNYIYVQFKLDRLAVVQIMNNGETLSNRTEINSYTVFKNNNGNTVAAVDRDSVPGNTKVENIETYEDDTDSAPAIQLELSDARKIVGTVFVDSTSGELLTGQIRQGNGIYDNGETSIGGVKVTLHEVNNSIDDIETTTDENGNFELSGYIPGQYTVTYIWGDKTYTVQNYKGTVYDSSRNQNDMYWYKDQVDTRKTDAIDNYQTRLAIDNEMAAITNNTINDQIAEAYNGGNNHPDVTKTTMDSTTPIMEFGVEYETAITDGTIDKVEFIVKNVDFGIVERARQQLDLIKRVSSFKITLANGQVLVDATVNENGELQGLHDYVTYMGPSVSNGYSNKGFIKAEIDNELIEGATLEVGYEIKFVNNSEKDFMSEKYYKYGIQEGNIVTLTPAAVVDYLDKNLGFEQYKNTDWEQITVDRLKELNAVPVKDENNIDIEFLNSRMILYTEKTVTPLQPTQTVTVGLNVSKLLSTSNDLSFDNDAETVTIKKPETSEHKGSVIKYFPIDDAEEVDITPSTGEDRNYVLPIVVGMISLVALGTGVFAIKKFIIKK